MRRAILTGVLLSLFLSSLALAGYQIDQVTTHPADCAGPSVASSPDGLTMIGYVADGYPLLMSFATVQQVPTTPAPGETWPDPVTLTSGNSPALCWTREGFVAAVGGGEMILMFKSDLDGVWDLVNYEMLDAGGPVMGIDLWGAPSLAAGPYAFMTVQVSTNPPDQDFKVLYSGATVLDGWSDFEVVAEEATQMPNPQMTWGIGPAGPWPRIFYLTSAFGGVDLVYTTKDLAADWSAPVVVPGDGSSAPSPIAGSFDVVASYPVQYNVLGLGPQPTCPCGSVHFLGTSPSGGWEPQVDMTVNHLDYDWPRPPKLGAALNDVQGQVHAFWMQEGSGPDLEPKTKTLEYWIKTQAGWIDTGGFLDGQDGGPLGDYVALEVSPASDVVMAWTRRDTIGGVPQPQQLWMARSPQPADVPSAEVSAATVKVTAWPNPFNPRVTLAMEAPQTGAATLDIFDLQGRKVVRLFEGELGEGSIEVAWDGRSDSGRRVPSGVYFARLETGKGKAVAKLLLAE